MMLARAVVALVLLAALLGAPPRASAAANQLLDPAVGPASGSTVTVFTFAVRYEGSFPAVAVTTTVAGLSLPMLLASGTASGGTWTAASMLPAGTWQPTFTAVAAQGNHPTLAGPSIAVTAPVATTDPTAAPSEVTPAEPGPGASVRAAPAEGGTSPTATPAPAAPAATQAPIAVATPTVAPSQTAPGEESPGASSGPGSSGSGGGSGSASEPGGVAGGTHTDDANAAPAGGQVLPGASPPPADAGAAGTTGPTPGGTRRPSGAEPSGHGIPATLGGDDPGEGGVGQVLAIGLTGVAAVALVGLAVLLARRRREAEPTRAAPSLAAAKRRRSRLAGVQLPDDPIVAALGLGRDEPRTRARPKRPPD